MHDEGQLDLRFQMGDRKAKTHLYIGSESLRDSSETLRRKSLSQANPESSGSLQCSLGKVCLASAWFLVSNVHFIKAVILSGRTLSFAKGKGVESLH